MLAKAPGQSRKKANSVRAATPHELTAETVIGALENAEDYKAFEAAITADYDAQSAVERELVLRLASLLWRLRRATTMETGLFEIQADHLIERKQARQVHPTSRELVYTLFGRTESGDVGDGSASHRAANETEDAPTLNSRGAFCVFPIYPTTRSTALAAMKQSFGASAILIALDALDPALVTSAVTWSMTCRCSRTRRRA